MTATIEAKPQPIAIDPARTAILVVDMQNDFGAPGGMFDRAGIDISSIRGAVAPTARVVAAARAAHLPVVYLKMAFRPDLSDAGPIDCPNHARHLFLICVESTIRDALFRDYSCVLVEDC